VKGVMEKEVSVGRRGGEEKDKGMGGDEGEGG